MNRIDHRAMPEWALDSMQMAAAFAHLHLGYRSRRFFVGGPRSRLTPISAGILLISIGMIIGQAQAQTISFTTNSTVDIGNVTTTVTSLLVSNNVTGTLTGAGGTLVYSGGPFRLGGTASGTQQTLNMPGLSNFVFNNPTQAFSVGGQVSGGGGSGNTSGTMTLAGTSNVITTASFGVADLTRAISANATNSGTVLLGQTNTINADQITIGTSQATGTLGFQSGITGGTLTLRGTDGISPVNTWGIAAFLSSNYTGSNGTVNLSQGSLDAKVSDLLIGASSSGSQSATGSLIMGNGTLDATSIILGQRTALSGAGGAQGTLSITGGTVLAQTLTIGDFSGTAGSATGIVTMNGGATLRAQSIQAGAGSATRTINWNDGTLGNYADGNDMTVSGASILLADSGKHTFEVDGTSAVATVNSTLSNAAGSVTGGTLIKGGTGTLTLTANNTYSGGTTISAGTLQLGNGGTTGSVIGNVLDNGTLVFNRSNALSYAGLVSGTGSLTQAGAGNLTLSTANTYTGATSIQGGTLTAGIANIFANSSAVSVDGGAIFALNNFAQVANNLSGAGSITLGSATLTANNSSDTNFSGVLSGAGGVTKTGGNALTLSGVGSAISGIFSVNAGSLIFAQGGLFAADVLTVGGGASAQINHGAQFTSLSTGTASAVSGTLTVSGLMNANDGISINAGGTLQIDSAGMVNVPGQLDAVVLAGTGSTLNNNGSIVATSTQAAVKVDSGASGLTSISNTGSIGSSTGMSSAANGIWVSSGHADIINRGAIFGGSAQSAISMTTSDNSLTLGTGSNLHGGSIAGSTNAAALSSGTGNTITLIETGSEGGDFLGGNGTAAQGFSQLTAATGSVWSLGGKINLIGTAADTLKVSGALTVTGQISNSGAGGGTTIEGGAALNLGNGGIGGSITGNVIDSGALTFDRSDVVTFGNAISGTGTVTQAGTGTTILTGTNTYTGGTSIGAGTLQIGNGGTTGSMVGNITDNAALLFNHSDTLNYGGVISGSGSVTQQGSGVVVLTGDSTYNGGTTITAGALQLGNGGASGSVVGNIANNAALIFNRSAAMTYGGVVSGTGSLTQAGSGTVTLTGVNTYAGGTYLAAGVLSVGADAGLGAVAGGLTFNGGALQFTSALTTARAVTLNATGTIDTQANTDTLTGVVAGTGALAKQGTGTLTVSGINTYTGGTNVNAGTLELTGTGTIGSGAANIAGAGTLSLNPAGGNYAFNNALTGSGVLNATLSSAASTFNFGANAGSAFTGNVTLKQSTFTLAGTNTSTLTNATLQLDAGNTTTVGAGGQTIGNLTLNGNALIFANLPSGILATGTLTLNSGAVRFNAGSAVDLTGSLLTQDDGASIRLISATRVNGSPSNLSLTDLAGNPLTASTVDIEQGGKTVGIGTYSFTLNTGAGTGLYAGYGLSQLDLQAGQTLTLAGDTATPAGAADMKARITGSGALTIDATNSITLINAANDYTGNTTVSGGTLVLGSDNALGNTALLALNAGTTADINGKTQAIGALSGAGALNIDAGNLTINHGGTFSGVIGGTRGALNANGGTLTLTGDNTYTGGTTVNAGTLQIGNGGTSGSYAGDILDNAAVAFNHSGNTTYGGVVSGSGSLSQQGSGTLVLTGDNTYTGGTAINAGTLQLGVGGTTGSVSGNIANNAALVFDRSDNTTYGGVISGTGSLTQQGNGALILTGNNTYTGSTTINAGTLQLGDGRTTGGVLGDITDNAALVFNRSDAATYEGVVSGSGSLTQQGSGTTTLTRANTYTGGTTISAGTLQLTGTGAIGSGNADIADSGTLLISNPVGGNYTFNNVLTGSGTLQAILGNSASAFALGSSVGSAFAGTIAIAGGTFVLDNNAQSAMPSTTLRLDTGGIAQIDANRTIGNLDFNGGAFQITSTGFIPDGKLTVGNLSVASSSTVALGIPSDFPVHPLPPQPSLFDQDDNIELQLIAATGTVTGTGSQLSLTKFDGSPVAAAQKVTLSENGTSVATASYNYTANVLAGVNAGVWLGYNLVQLDLQAGQTLELTNANAIDNTLSARITGSGSLFIDAVNTAILNNATNDYTGATTLNSGTLVLGSNNALGHTALLAVSAGATADINGKTQAIGALGGAGALNIDAGNLTINNGGTFSGVISGTSGALNANGGTLVLSGENTYSGGTTINAGTLQIGNGGTTGSYAGNITDNAALAFNRSDALSYGGVVSGTGSLVQQGSGALTLTGNNTYTGGTTISGGTLQLGNGGTVGSIAGDVSNNGILAFDRSDILTFNGSITGTGSVTQAGSGMVLFNGVQTYSGATNVNAGTLAIGDASHLGAELAGGGLITVGAAAALGGYGKVAGSVINNGVIAVGNALPAFANGPDASFTIAGNLDNRGTLTMSNGVAGDRMVTGGTYTSNGGKVLIDTVLNQGGAASNSDLLVVGSTLVGARGATQLVVANVGGAGATTVDNGIMVVQVQDPAHSATGAFSLSGRAVAGPYEYQLFQGGQQDSDGNWYLRTQLEPTPPTPPTPPGPPTPPAPPQPLFRPEVAAYLANQHVAGEMFIHSLDDRYGGTSQTSRRGSSAPGSVWLRVEGRNEGSNSGDGTFHVNTDSFLMQGGGEVAQKKLTSNADLLHLGLMATYETARSNVEAAGNSAGASGNVAGYSVGAYGTWYQNEASRLGAYADTWLQYGWFNNSVDGDQLPTVNYNARGWAVSGELGYAFPLIDGWVFEPQGQLLYVDYHQNSLTEPNGTQVDGANSSGAVTRLGLRLQRTFQRSAGKMQFYATANWWHTSTDSAISFDQVSVGSLYPANRYEAKLGLNGDLGKNWSAWSNVSGAWGAQSYHAYVVRLGLRYAW